MKDFFAFRKLISVDLIKIVYMIGLFLITIGSISSIFYSTSDPFGVGAGLLGLPFGAGLLEQGLPFGVVTGLLGLTFGNLFWRVSCEAFILLFSIHETLNSIDVKLEK